MLTAPHTVLIITQATLLIHTHTHTCPHTNNTQPPTNTHTTTNTPSHTHTATPPHPTHTHTYWPKQHKAMTLRHAHTIKGDSSIDPEARVCVYLFTLPTSNTIHHP